MPDPTPTARPGHLDPEAAALFASGVARFVLDRAIPLTAGEEWVRRLNVDGHPEPARMVQVAVDEARRRRLSSVLPGGAR